MSDIVTQAVVYRLLQPATVTGVRLRRKAIARCWHSCRADRALLSLPGYAAEAWRCKVRGVHPPSRLQKRLPVKGFHDRRLVLCRCCAAGRGK